MSILYHEGSRKLQDAFASRRIADRLEQVTTHTAFTADDTAFIEARMFFFLATADSEGRPDCSHKGGAPGFVRVVAPDELAFPDYDGNGMFKSLGNITVNAHVGLLFVDFEAPRRLRVNGSATVSRDDPLLSQTVGAQLIVRVKARAIFPAGHGFPRAGLEKLSGVQRRGARAAKDISRLKKRERSGTKFSPLTPKENQRTPSNAIDVISAV
jgi:uncharacterized protein